MADFLDTELKYLKGVGEARAGLLSKELDIHTFRDLLYNFPFRHVDRSRFYRIADLRHGELPAIQIKGCFVNFREEGEGLRKRLVAAFSDGARLMEVVWFAKTKAIKAMLRVGEEYVIFGKPAEYRGVWSMAHPEIERFDPSKPPSGLRGIYSLTDTMRKRGFSMQKMQEIAGNLLDNPAMARVADPLPRQLVERYHLMPFSEAVREMHFPTGHASLAKAIERMKFEELFYVEMHILRFSRSRGEKTPGYVFPKIGRCFNDFFFNVLPFQLTGAQKRVLHEIRDDMRTGRQMNRLLQGDVGCGKTMVAFMTMLMAVDNGCQGALMAPTEILAEQHAETLRQWAQPLGIRVELLTGSTRTAARREILASLASGDIHILVGTHALIEDKVEFRRLGVAVIDEQHRFGVAQRSRMWTKGTIVPPHVLVMTATPIPRTLAMTVYGDLEVSVIDELPPGRKPVDTWLRYDDNRIEVDRLIFSQLREGRQVYIVYPLITENEKLDLKSLEEGYRRTCEVYSKWPVCYVHGRMKPAEKDYQMGRFVSGEARIMVATTVIEVGVNVPNASVMVIENAERFGLSQLHQLRGRVGRGADKSYCILMSHQKIGADTRKRLSIMTETTDGFLIAEADMKLRGPGDMEGTLQSGLAFDLKVSDLARDGQIVSLARRAAFEVLDGNPGRFAPGAAPQPGLSPLPLSEPDARAVSSEIARRFAVDVDWSRIS